MPPKKAVQAAPTIAVRPDALEGKKCIITGEIDAMKRKDAEQILINAGATIEKSLNKKVELVVLGKDAGPKKLEKIEELGIETKEWDELIEEIKGEIKGEGGTAAPLEEPKEEEHDDEDEEMEEVEEKPKAKKAKAKANTKAKAAPASKPKASGSVSSLLDGKTVIVTGTITGHERKDAQAILEKAGAKIAKSLNKQVELVILGINPGPDKMKKIEDLGIETIQWKEVAGELGIEVVPEKEIPTIEAGDAPDSIEGMTLIITGEIDGHTRSAAQKILEGAGAKFAKSLNKSVELVVLGAKPGPDKLSKISDMGLGTCSWETLIEKLGIEAEASEPPKKKAKKA